MTDDALVRMANQIASNCAHLPPREAAEVVANHLRNFWAPPMRADLRRVAEDDPGSLDPLVHAALEQSHSPV